MRSPSSARPFGSIRPSSGARRPGGARSPDGVCRPGGVSRPVPRSAPVDGPASDRRPERVDAPPAPEALDLRLAPVALATWAAAGWGCAAGVRACLGAGAGALAAAGIALAPALRHRPARHRHDPRPGAQVPGGARGSVAASALVVALACASVLGVTAALLHVRERDPLTAAAAASRRATLIATVTSAPRPVVTARRTAVLVELGVRSVDGAPSRQKAVVLGDSRWLDLPLGATVRVHGPLRAAQPGSAEAAWLGAGASVRVLADPSGSLARVGRLREGLARAAGAEPDGGGRAAEQADVDGAPAGPSAPRWPPGARALVPGVALGDDHALPQTVREEMRAVSMTHLTAVSGQHVALVLGLVLTGLGAVPRRARAGAGLVVLTGLVVLVRPGGSVLRAGVMGAVMLAGVASGRRSVSVPALAGAVLILVLIDPWQSRDYGFALSVAATAGILVGERPARAALSRRLPRWLAASLALPLVAQAVCAPVLILLQPQVGLWSVPANVIAAPPVPLATICGLAAALVEPLWPGAAAWAALPAVASCAWLAAVAHLFAALPGARIPWPGGWAGAVGLAVLEAAAALLVSRRARRRLLRAVRGPARAALAAALRTARSPAPAPRRPRSPAPRGRLGPWHRPDPPAAAHAPPRRAPPGTRSPSRRSSSSAPVRRSSPTAPSPAWWPWPARGTRRPGSPRSRPPPTSPTGSTPSSRPPCSASPGSSSSPPWSR